MTSDAKLVVLTVVLFAILFEEICGEEVTLPTTADPTATTMGADDAATTMGMGAHDAVTTMGMGAHDATTTMGMGAHDAATTMGMEAHDAATTTGVATTESTPILPPFDWVAVPKPSMYRNLTSVPQLATGDIIKIPGRKINKNCLTGRVSEVWQYNDEAQWETESFENCIYACLMFGEECYSASFSYDMPLCFLFNANIDTDEECFEEQEEGQKWDSFAL